MCFCRFVPLSESIPVSTSWTAPLSRVSVPRAPSAPFCFCYCLISVFCTSGLSLEQAIASGEPRAQRSEAKKICVPKSASNSGPFDKFHFLPEESFSDVGGWVGQPGLARVPNIPPPQGGSLSNSLLQNLNKCTRCSFVCVCVCVMCVCVSGSAFFSFCGGVSGKVDHAIFQLPTAVGRPPTAVILICSS